MPLLYLHTKLVVSRGFTYNFNFDFIKRVMELLIGPGHIFTDALLSEATLPRIPLIWIPEYLAGLMKL